MSRHRPGSGPLDPGVARGACPPEGGKTPSAGMAERGLRIALFGAFGLLLLTPFVVTPATVFPFVVGKALWSRALIELAFALWAVLALMRREYRPPRSWLLVLLGISVAVSLAAAWAGASPQRSFWSTYERMRGVVDEAHWAVLGVVLASSVRDPRGWRRLLGAAVISSAVLAGLVLARAAGVEVPFFGQLPEPRLPRYSGPLGNPTFLSVCMVVNLVLATGFAVDAGRPRPGQFARVTAAAGWSAVAALHLAGLALSGSLGGFAGLAGAVCVAALALAVSGRGRGRLAGVAALALLIAGASGLGMRFTDPERTSMLTPGAASVLPGGGALDRLGRMHLQRPGVQSRLGAWETALQGFAERPLLGWGPENFGAVYGRFASGYAATAQPHGQPHGRLVEAAAETGAAGVLAWIALWGGAVAALLRARSRARGRERTLALFAAAALAGYLVQLQSLFDTAAGMLTATLLLAFAARMEAAALPPVWRPGTPGWLAGAFAARWGAFAGRRAVRGALGAAALSAALAGLWVQHAILRAADARYSLPAPLASGVLAEGIDAFPPLANTYRKYLFERLAHEWPWLRARDAAAAAKLLRWADGEAREAVRFEPEDWRIAGALARLYRAAAATEPGYRLRAREHLARARALAPNRAVFRRPLAPPGELAAKRVAGGGLELAWRKSPGAGYHQLSRAARPGVWRSVLYAYGDAPGAYVAGPCPGCRYRVKACRYPRDCSAWAAWPAADPWAPGEGNKP